MKFPFPRLRMLKFVVSKNDFEYHFQNNSAEQCSHRPEESIQGRSPSYFHRWIVWINSISVVHIHTQKIGEKKLKGILKCYTLGWWLEPDNKVIKVTENPPFMTTLVSPVIVCSQALGTLQHG